MASASPRAIRRAAHSPDPENSESENETAQTSVEFIDGHRYSSSGGGTGFGIAFKRLRYSSGVICDALLGPEKLAQLRSDGAGTARSGVEIATAAGRLPAIFWSSNGHPAPPPALVWILAGFTVGKLLSLVLT